jgi:hypothetical protein
MFTSVIEFLVDISLNWKNHVHIVLRGFGVLGFMIRDFTTTAEMILGPLNFQNLKC